MQVQHITAWDFISSRLKLAVSWAALKEACPAG